MKQSVYGNAAPVVELSMNTSRVALKVYTDALGVLQCRTANDEVMLGVRWKVNDEGKSIDGRACPRTQSPANNLTSSSKR